MAVVEKKNREMRIGLIVVAMMAVIIINIEAYNYEYVNVTTEVNVTNAYPIIESILIEQNIILSAGTVWTVYCNVSITDYNGWGTLVNVNATFWDNASVNFNDTDNANNHYTNTSCNITGNDGQYVSNYSCAFNVWYYANPSTNWICNVTVIDDYNFTDTNYNTTTVEPYYAINVTPIIDYGDMFLGAISPNITANITNIGNSQINVSLRGYGSTPGDGYAMICAIGNITIDNERYSTNTSSPWASKTLLTSSLVNLSDFTIPKRITSQTWNLTYWQLYTDPTNVPFGVCNGTVEFNAFAG